MAQVTPFDEVVRGALTRLIADTGRGPTHDALAQAVGATVVDVEASLDRLHASHSLLLHPHERRVWVAHPFALAPGSCWVETPKHGYWSNCLYCAFGVAAAIRQDAVITTRFGGEAETVTFSVRDGELVNGTDFLFHLSTPVAHWWDNVIHACSTFQPFRTRPDVDAWCERHGLPHGHMMTVGALWPFAREWYGEYVVKPWHKRTPEEIRALFARHGLTSSFWNVTPS